jgi:hypothetical protein
VFGQSVARGSAATKRPLTFAQDVTLGRYDDDAGDADDEPDT